MTQTTPISAEQVEAAARAFDPWPFKSWQLSYDYEMGQSGDADEAKDFADWSMGKRLAEIRAALAALTAAASIPASRGVAELWNQYCLAASPAPQPVQEQEPVAWQSDTVRQLQRAIMDEDEAVRESAAAEVGQLYATSVAPYAAALAMVREAIGEMFGPVASIESKDASLLRGPEPHHEAEAQIAALQRVAASPPEQELTAKVEYNADVADFHDALATQWHKRAEAAEAKVERLMTLIEDNGSAWLIEHARAALGDTP